MRWWGGEEDVRRTVARRAVVPLECNLPEFCCQNLDIVKYVPLRDSTHIYIYICTAHLNHAHIFMQPLGRTSLYILSFMETIFCHICVPDGRKLTVRQLRSSLCLEIEVNTTAG